MKSSVSGERINRIDRVGLRAYRAVRDALNVSMENAAKSSTGRVTFRLLFYLSLIGAFDICVCTGSTFFHFIYGARSEICFVGIALRCVKCPQYADERRRDKLQCHDPADLETSIELDVLAGTAYPNRYVIVDLRTSATGLLSNGFFVAILQTAQSPQSTVHVQT